MLCFPFTTNLTQPSMAFFVHFVACKVFKVNLKGYMKTVTTNVEAVKIKWLYNLSYIVEIQFDSSLLYISFPRNHAFL